MPSSGGMATFRPPAFAVDGGVLLNKPIRPALEAIYRQAASAQVRRLLVYVVPDPGVTREQTAPPPVRPPRTLEPPKAQEVLLGVLTRLRSTDSVSRELQQIREQNDATRLRRRTRERLAAALAETASDGPAGSGGLATAAWDAYRETRVEQAVRTIAALVAAGIPAAGPTTDSFGRSKTRLAWSEEEVATALHRWRRHGGATTARRCRSCPPARSARRSRGPLATGTGGRPPCAASATSPSTSSGGRCGWRR